MLLTRRIDIKLTTNRRRFDMDSTSNRCRFDDESTSNRRQFGITAVRSSDVSEYIAIIMWIRSTFTHKYFSINRFFATPVKILVDSLAACWARCSFGKLLTRFSSWQIPSLLLLVWTFLNLRGNSPLSESDRGGFSPRI